MSLTLAALASLSTMTSSNSTVSVHSVTSSPSSPSSSHLASSSSPSTTSSPSSPSAATLHHYSLLDSGLHESRPWEVQPLGEFEPGLPAPARITLIAGLVFGLWMILAVAAWLSRGCLTSHTHAHSAYRHYGPESKSLTDSLRSFWQSRCSRTRTDSRESLNAPALAEQYGAVSVYNQVFAVSSDDEELAAEVASEHHRTRRTQRAKLVDWIEQQEQYLTVEVERPPPSPTTDSRKHALPVLMITDTQTRHTDIVEEDEQGAARDKSH